MEVKDVVDFLANNGFAEAAAALLDEVGSRDEGDPVLMPVRTGSGRGGGKVTVELVDSESDAFLSIGGSGGESAEGDESSGVGPLHAAEFDDSSSDFSDFRTARDYNFPSLFGDKNWHNEKLAGFSSDPFPLQPSSSGCSSEDKFLTGMQTENIYGKRKDLDFRTETNMSSLKMPESREDGQSGDSDEIYGEYQSAEMISGENKSTVWFGNSGSLSQRSSSMPEKVVEPQALQEHGRMPNNVSHVSHPVEIIKSVVPQPSEKELHILSSSTHKVDVEDQKVGSWESDLLDYSFQMSISLKGEKNTNDSQLLGKELRIRSLPFGNEISYSTSSNEVDLKETKNTNHLAEESLTTTEESENLHSGFGSLFDTKREPSKAKLNGDGKQNSGSNNDDLLVSGEGEHDGDDAPQIHLSNDSDYEVFDLRIVHRKNRTGFEENKDLPIILNSVIAGRYFVTEYLGSAAFSKVVQAHDLQTGVDVCLKIIKNNKDFFDQSLDEIKLLKFVNKHDPADELHILRLYDYFYHQEHLFIVSELLKANLYEFQKYNLESGGEVYYTFSRIQSIALQCLKGLEFLHNLGIIHCDLKPENILIKSYTRCEIKIIDLGSSCFETDSLCLYVQSRSYRAPEVILGVPYDQKIDIWSLGCILAELFSGEVLFPNDPVSLLLGRMIRILGPFDMEMLNLGTETNKYFTDSYDIYQMNEETNKVEYVIPQRSSLAQHLNYPDPVFIDFLTYLLQTNPQKRPRAKEALQHPWLVYPYQ